MPKTETKQPSVTGVLSIALMKHGAGPLTARQLAQLVLKSEAKGCTPRQTKLIFDQLTAKAGYVLKHHSKVMPDEQLSFELDDTYPDPVTGEVVPTSQLSPEAHLQIATEMEASGEKLLRHAAAHRAAAHLKQSRS